MVRLISTVHILCILFLLLGFLLPLQVVYYHLAAVPLVILQWWLNKNQCVLTQLQKKFEEPQQGHQESLEGNFTRDLLLKFGLNLSEKQILVLIYVLMVSSWLLSLKRIL